MVEIFLFILVAGLLANFIGASVHEGIFVGALVRPSPYFFLHCTCNPHNVMQPGLSMCMCLGQLTRSTYTTMCVVPSITALPILQDLAVNDVLS